MGVEQHLVGLEQIGPYHKGPAVAELGMGRLQLDPLAPDQRPVLTPIELESFSRLKGQGNEHAAAGGVLLALEILFPAPGKNRHPTIGAFKAKADQIGMDLLDRTPLLARFAALSLQPA